MFSKHRKETEGFTIIEVLIVLAIAGLIILIVFLAVPALQRNARNTSYRSEASQLLAATSEYITNNNGAIPVASISSTSGSDAAKIIALTKNRNITVLKVEVYSGSQTAATLSQATLATGAKCVSNATVAGAGRQIALLFAVEDSTGAATAQCIDS